MISHRSRNLLRTLCWGGLAWLGGVVYLCVATGVPLPVATSLQHGLFPCSGGHCGCATAEQCWRGCCCYTLEQRLAWAERNHVVPPDYVLAQARLDAAKFTRIARTCHAASRSCCRPIALASVPARGRCCARPHQGHPVGANEADAGVIVLRDALRCSGRDSHAKVGIVSFVPLTAATVLPVEPFSWRLVPERHRYSSATPEPPVPPPKIG